jgi:hypothetical protein
MSAGSNWLPNASLAASIVVPFAVTVFGALLKPHLEKVSAWSAGLTLRGLLRALGSSRTLLTVNAAGAIFDVWFMHRFVTAQGDPTRPDILSTYP